MFWLVLWRSASGSGYKMQGFIDSGSTKVVTSEELKKRKIGNKDSLQKIKKLDSEEVVD